MGICKWYGKELKAGFMSFTARYTGQGPTLVSEVVRDDSGTQLNLPHSEMRLPSNFSWLLDCCQCLAGLVQHCFAPSAWPRFISYLQVFKKKKKGKENKLSIAVSPRHLPLHIPFWMPDLLEIPAQIPALLVNSKPTKIKQNRTLEPFWFVGSWTFPVNCFIGNLKLPSSDLLVYSQEVGLTERSVWR